MAVVLAYVDAVPGRLYPLLSALQELLRRGHRVAVRCGIDDVERLRSIGLRTQSITSEIERFAPDDWRAKSRFGALRSGLGQFGERVPFQVADLERAIEAERPDVLLIDEGAWGAAAAAERSDLPWAFTPVLEQAACVVCHAGMGITQKALAHGVPVVAIPFGRDQPEVARRVEVAGAGVRLPLRKLSADRLRAAVRTAMQRRSGAERVGRAFADAGGAPRAADALEELARGVPG